MSETEKPNVERIRALQARRAALAYIHWPNSKGAEQEEIGAALRRISVEIDDMTKLAVTPSPIKEE